MGLYWWEEQAGAEQRRVIRAEEDKIVSYDKEEIEQSIVQTRRDMVLLYSHLTWSLWFLNKIKNRLTLIAILIALGLITIWSK